MVGMKALLSGGTGFVGGRLAERLRADGVEVRCLVRDPSRAQRLAEIFELQPRPFAEAARKALRGQDEDA
jgi:uncharacterized protein YbjT (DUF2867 family)